MSFRSGASSCIKYGTGALASALARPALIAPPHAHPFVLRLPYFPRSLDRKLPALISILLLATIVLFVGTTYRELGRTLRRSGGERLRFAAGRIATLLDRQLRQMTTAARTAADTDALRLFLASGGRTGRARAEAALRPLIPATDERTVIELLARDGHPVLRVGPSRTTDDAPAADSLLRARATSSGAVVGPLRARGDTLVYDVAAPVLGGAPDAAVRDTLGVLVEHRVLLSSPGAGQTVSDLVGREAVLDLGDPSTGIWTDLSRRIAPPSVAGRLPARLTSARDTGVVVRLADRVGAAVPVGATSWVVWVAMPSAALLAPAHDFLGRMTGIAILIALLGAFAAWLLSRDITAPLGLVTAAAERVAAGDLDERVPATRRDEIGRLAEAFNTMTDRVRDARRHLEQRVAERTAELRTTLRRLEEAQAALVQRERLAVLGQLASSVGHELRNPLGVMNNAVYFLEMVLPDAPPTAKEYFGILRTQIGLSERIVGDLLDYARVKPPQREPVTLESLVDTQLHRLGPLTGVVVERDFPPGLPPALVDPVQIGQVVLNVLANAVQAMGEHGGTLRVRGRGDAAAGVRLEIADTGPGMAPDVLARVFEPLFTTKARGLGLGLAVSRSLVQANDGAIDVASTPGAGATFTITLPAAAAVEAA